MTEQLDSLKSEVREQLSQLGIDVDSPYPVAKDVSSDIAVRHLSNQESLFVIEYLSDGNPERAYSVVFGVPLGLSSVPAQQLLSKAHIQKTITEIYDKIGSSLSLTKNTIVAKLWEIANKKGVKASDQIKALELIAKLENLIKSIKDVSDLAKSNDKFTVNVQINNEAGPKKDVMFEKPKLTDIEP